MIMYFPCNNRGYYIWQKSHQSKLIRFDLRTKDFHIASLRSKVLLNTYYHLKRECLSFQEIKEHLIAERDRYIDHEIHVQVVHFCWRRNEMNLPVSIPVISKQKSTKISSIAKEWYEEMSGDWRPLTFKGNKAAADFFINWYRTRIL